MSFLSRLEDIGKKVDEAFKEFFGTSSKWTDVASTTLSFAVPAVNMLLTVEDPALAAVVAPILARVQSKLVQAKVLISAGEATPTLTGILNAVKADFGTIESLAEVKNSAHAAQIDTDVVTAINAVESVMTIVEENTAPATSLSATKTVAEDSTEL